MAPPRTTKLTGRLDGVRTRHVWTDGTLHDITQLTAGSGVDHTRSVISREVVELTFEDGSVGHVDDTGLAHALAETCHAMVWHRDGHR